MPRKGQHISEETRQRMREGAAKRWATPGYREQISAAQKALNQDPEYYEQRITAVRASLADPEVAARHFAASQGTERRRKISEAQRGRKDSPEVRARKSQARIGMTFSPEHCEHISQALSKRGPETIAKLREARLRQKMPNKMTDIERLLRDGFLAHGLTFEMHRTMYGRFQPDFVFDAARLIVEADGVYWHTDTGRKGSGKAIARDSRFNALAAADGWTVFRFPEAEILAHPDTCVDTVTLFVNKS